MVSKQVREDLKRETAENKRLMEKREKLQSHLMELKKKTKELKLEKNLLVDLLMKKQPISASKTSALNRKGADADEDKRSVAEEDRLQPSTAEQVLLD